MPDGPQVDMTLDPPAGVDMGGPAADMGPAGCGAAGKTCAGTSLQTCGTDGMLTSTPCVNGCNAVRLECNTCKPNERVCSGNQLVVCNGEGTGTTMMACTSGCNTTLNECNGCMPNSKWCNGATLQTCGADGVGVTGTMCSNGCSMARQACNVCNPGSKICSGSTLQTCSSDGSGWVDTACGNDCNSTRLECNACNPSAVPTCSGSSVRTCRSDGSGTTDSSCANGCMSGRCNECQPSERTCSGTTQRVCGGNGTWTDTRCQAPGGGTATCASGNCGFTCGGGVSACNNNTACPKLSWDFENGLEGVEVSTMFTEATVSNLRTAQFLGSNAMALEVAATASASAVAIRIPFCGGQQANLRGKRLSLRYWLEGDPISADAYSWIIHETPANRPYTGLDDPQVREWMVVDVSLARAPGLDEMVQAGILFIYTGGPGAGAPPPDGVWRGTLYVDEIRVQ